MNPYKQEQLNVEEMERHVFIVSATLFLNWIKLKSPLELILKNTGHSLESIAGAGFFLNNLLLILTVIVNFPLV